ncbi:uncharacterized protein HGUI_01695 [Hanseniaspora guilliermondii]|uniref:DH domain-containing protein n=1 Tax=Hanseniaspora guilliermondii TaxID=56406 RepID=A0A1L0CXD8_9ASCO|nr:uncharacterized protein HGUI_01695 [Hanseniaspora guilliermondii]
MNDQDDLFLSDITAASIETNSNRDVTNNVVASHNSANINVNQNSGHEIENEHEDKYINIIQESPAFHTAEDNNEHETQQANNFLPKKSKTSYKKKISFKKIIDDVSTLDYGKSFVSISDIAKKHGNIKESNRKKVKEKLTHLTNGSSSNPFTMSGESNVKYILNDSIIDDKTIKKIQIYYDDKNKFSEKDNHSEIKKNIDGYQSILIQLKSLINEIVQTEIQYLMNLKIMTDNFLPFIMDSNNTTLNMLTYYSTLLAKNHQLFLEEMLGFFAEIKLMNFLKVDMNNVKALNLKTVGQKNWKSIEHEYYMMLKNFDYANSALNIDNNTSTSNFNNESNILFGYYLVLDYLSLKTTNVVSTYLYENYIKVYYIMLRVLKNKEKTKFNTKMCDSISGLNSLMSIKQKTYKLKRQGEFEHSFEDDHLERSVFNNITFESLLQVPVNRIMKYKIFMSKILTEYNIESRCKFNIALNFNDLLKKLEKIDNFQLDYAYTIQQSRYKAKGKNNEFEDDIYDPNERYSKIVDKIKFNKKDLIFNCQDNESPLNFESFGSIILLQPCIIRYVSTTQQTFFGFKDTSKLSSENVANNTNMNIFQESKVIVLLFKSHLLILKPSKVNKECALNVVFSLPLAICELVDENEQTLIEDSNNSINLKVEFNFLMYEIMILSWNLLEHENLSNKLENLMEYYNKPLIKNQNNEEERRKNTVYKHGNDYSLSKESLLNNRSLKFNDINDFFNQFIHPKNMVICEYQSEYFDDLELSYNKRIFFIKNRFLINKSAYTDIEKEWVCDRKKQSYIGENNSNHIVDINFEDRMIVEKYLDSNKLWYNEIDILRLKDFEVLHMEQKTSTKISNFLNRTRDHKRGSFRDTIRKKTSFIGKSLVHSAKSDNLKPKSGSHTTTSDKSLLYLPSVEILQSAQDLRSSILKNNDTNSYCNNGTMTGVLFKTGSIKDEDELQKLISDSGAKKFSLSDETIMNDPMVSNEVEQSLKTQETSFSDVLNEYVDDEDSEKKNTSVENSNGYFVNSIVIQSTKMLSKLFI